MYIHDVIHELRRTNFHFRQDLAALRLQVSLMEVYLSQVSDYPAPPSSVPRETLAEMEENFDADATLF